MSVTRHRLNTTRKKITDLQHSFSNTTCRKPKVLIFKYRIKRTYKIRCLHYTFLSLVFCIHHVKLVSHSYSGTLSLNSNTNVRWPHDSYQQLAARAIYFKATTSASASIYKQIIYIFILISQNFLFLAIRHMI